jgi:hypothetical protein
MENGSPQAMIQIIKIANVMAYCHFPFIKHLPGVHTGDINIHQTLFKLQDSYHSKNPRQGGFTRVANRIGGKN